MSEIHTSRLRLRKARHEDLDALHAVFTADSAMRYWSTPPHTDISETRDWLDRHMAASPEESCDYLIEHRGKVIGKAGCWRIPEIGFILHPSAWGQGFAREAVQAVINHVWDTFQIPAIEADVDPRNAASLAVLTKLGFREVGRARRTWKVGDEWCDSVYLALPRPTLEYPLRWTATPKLAT